MRNRMCCIVDALESRRLLSGAPTPAAGHWDHGPFIPPLPGSATALDKANYAAVQADLTAVQTDQGKVESDFGALQTAYKNALTTTPVKNAQAALQSAQATAKPLIQADLSAIQAVYAKDEPAVDAAQHQLWVDIRSGAVSSVIAADQAALKAAQTTLSNELAAPQAQLQKDEAPVKTAEQALKTAINDDPGVVAAKKTLSTDQSALSTADTQFQKDLATYVSDLKAGI